ncbi:MAG TPA: type II toxin-antitoxin system Phd/YefM family antitoxin [Candidatus Binataceae bacterium]|nr:type II toxin-antitoxin system Phd/YefM family antitoxin [Candidatus Binataceae bacterium]
MKRNHRKNGATQRKKSLPVEPPRRLGDEDISIADLRARLGDLVARVSWKHERVVITKHGKPVAALISASDMEKFQELEDWNDVAAAKAADRETKKAGGPIPWRTVERELKLRRTHDARR